MQSILAKILSIDVECRYSYEGKLLIKNRIRELRKGKKLHKKNLLKI